MEIYRVSNKANAKRLLKHNFKENSDYKIVFIRTDENKTLLIPTDQQVPNIKYGKNIGGRTVIRTDDGKFSNETIMLNINTFKKLCLKANTENADKIHDYYIKLEMIYNELMKEELENKDINLQNTTFLSSQGVYTLKIYLI
jgi:phage anti-repressor protein